jgi:hypothetical protein
MDEEESRKPRDPEVMYAEASELRRLFPLQGTPFGLDETDG